MTIRYFKAGLTLIVALAFSATMASTATALKITPSKFPAILTGGSNGATLLMTSGVETKCVFLSTEATVKEPSESLTVIPSYGGCDVTGGELRYEMQITMQGCDYLRHGGVQANAHTFTKGTVDIQCPEGVTGPIIDIWYGVTQQPCVYTVEAASNVGSITVTNETEGFVDKFSAEWEMPTTLKRDGSLLCGTQNQDLIASWNETMQAFEDLEGKEGSKISVTTSE